MRARWLFVLLAAVVAAAPLAAQRLTFTARKDIVRVDVLVAEAGQPVRGLAVTDFDVFDNGIRQRVELMSAESTPVDAILTFDLSGSVAGDLLGRLKRAGNAVLSALTDREQAALITFSRSILLESALTHDRQRVRDALDSVQSSGDTALIDASYAALVLGESDSGRGVVIVFSDGLDSASWLSAAAVLDTARRTNTVVYAVSTAELPRASFLRDLTTATGGTLFEVDSTNDLDALFVRVLNEFRQRYLLSYSPQDVPPEGSHKIEVRVHSHPGATVKARPGYVR